MKNYKTDNSPIKPLIPCSTTNYKESICKLKQEIASFEEELRITESTIRSIKSQIQSRYYNEIVRINDLYTLFKKQKKLKKEKRLDQKKRGKNFKEPKVLKLNTKGKSQVSKSTSSDSHELKNLYREAVLQIHPDKFANHPDQMSKRSLELTIQLIDFYQNGDFKKVKQMHRHIMSGNAMSGHQEDTSKVPDPAALKEYLVHKRDTLFHELKDIKGSYFYQVFSTNNNLPGFIDSMAPQFFLRIKQLKRRTRS